MAPPRPPLTQQAKGALLGLSAAGLFGFSAPLSKLLLAQVSPVLLAGLLYLGAAIGLWLHRLVGPRSKEAPLKRGDAGILSVVVALGGVAGPILMLFGLNRVSALSGSLLLGLEAPLTVVLALVFFREHLGRNGAVAAILMVTGAGVLKLEGGNLAADTIGVLLLAGAAACWAIDNNLTQRLSLRDPFAIVRVKTLVAGVTNTALGLVVAHGNLPPIRFIAGSLVLGSLSYGVSVVLDAYALRFVGAAREAAYFAMAPFIGAVASVAVLGEPFQLRDGVAMGLMLAGLSLLLRERHLHTHEHQPLSHEHLHEHDAHHQHEHRPNDPPGAKHSHAHTHAPLTHDHPHLPDAHHRHEH